MISISHFRRFDASHLEPPYAGVNHLLTLIYFVHVAEVIQDASKSATGRLFSQNVLYRLQVSADHYINVRPPTWNRFTL